MNKKGDIKLGTRYWEAKMMCDENKDTRDAKQNAKKAI